jgi:hypothetical protein
MTDLPPRTTPPRTEDRRIPDGRPAQTSMWIVLLVVAAVIIAAVAFTLDRSDTAVEQTAPAAVEPSTNDATPVEGTGTTTETTPTPDGTAAPAPATNGTTTAP